MISLHRYQASIFTYDNTKSNDFWESFFGLTCYLVSDHKWDAIRGAIQLL